jgi:WbqC-like protein family
MIQPITTSNDPRRIDLPGRVLVSHQSEFMPWLGFISKASMGDVFLLLDDTQFKKKYFENRNKIRYPNDNGWLWLNIPVKNKNSLPNMMDVVIANSKWKQIHLKAITTAYSKCPHFDAIIKLAFKLFDIKIPFFRTSELKTEGYEITGTSTKMVVSLCKAVHADILVAGASGKDYLNVDIMNTNNIKTVYQKFYHPRYPQKQGSFISNMSYLDLLFNCGEYESIKILGKSEYIF